MTQITKVLIDDLRAEGWVLLTTTEYQGLKAQKTCNGDLIVWLRELIQYAPSCPTCRVFTGHDPECELAEVLG